VWLLAKQRCGLARLKPQPPAHEPPNNTGTDMAAHIATSQSINPFNNMGISAVVDDNMKYTTEVARTIAALCPKAIR
jgi:hypothetical protein